MPEKTGTVTGFITNPKKGNAVMGLHIDGSEFVYSLPEYRGTPFADDVVVGQIVRIEYQDTTDKAGKPKRYISVLEHTEAPPPEPEPQFPPPEQMRQDVGGLAREWGYEQKDRLMCRESCVKSAVAIFAASITAGIYKAHPDVIAITAFATGLETWCLKALEPTNPDEIPFE